MERRRFLRTGMTGLISLALPAGAGSGAFGGALQEPAAKADPTPESDLALKPGEREIQPSFETCSYYFLPKVPPAEPPVVEYRRKGDDIWRAGFAPVCDRPADIWKGSLFGLSENSDYELRIRSGPGDTVTDKFRTWTGDPPVARVVDLSRLDPQRKGGLVISDQGTPDGWIKYVAPPGWTLERPYDIDDPLTAAITFRDARFVILDGVTIVGGLRYAILVDRSESVRILNCDLSGWGRVGVQQFVNGEPRGKYLDAKGKAIDLDGGVEINRSRRTVVERCYIHDPRHRSNSWMWSHPNGPSAVHVNYTRGGTVLRWNDMIGSDEHRWNDVIESSSNSSPVGGFYRDSDITGNFLAFGNDDGVELEGGGMNVRFYANKVEGTTSGVSTGAGLLGPQFIIGNLLANPGDESGLSLQFFKNRYRSPQGGRRFFINNTLYGPTCSAITSYGETALPVRIGFMRNNLCVCSDSQPPAEWAKRDDFDNDLVWTGDDARSRAFLAGVRAFGLEARGLAANPAFVAPERGDFHIRPDSPARYRAAAVADLCRTGEDLGAFFGGRTELPHRPLALIAEPRQLDFTPHDGGVASAGVVLSVPKGAKAIDFRIRKNRAFGWFTVTPDTGRIEPGRTLTLTVTVDPARLRGRPLFKGAFLVRTPEGLSRPVTVYAQGHFVEEIRPVEAPNSLYRDAADLHGIPDALRKTEDPGVAGRQYAALRGSPAAPVLETGFPIAKSGIYSLLARIGVDGDALNPRALELSVGGSAPVAVPINTDSQWNTGDRHFRVVYLYSLGDLAPGDLKLRLKLTKGNLNLNQLIVTDNPAAFFRDHWQREMPQP